MTAGAVEWGNGGVQGQFGEGNNGDGSGQRDNRRVSDLDRRFRVVRGRGMQSDGNSAAGTVEAPMSGIPKEAFRRVKTYKRLTIAEKAISEYAEQAALDNHHSTKAGFYELIACCFRELDREDTAARYEAKRDEYLRIAQARQAGIRRRPKRKRVDPSQPNAPQARRETPVSQDVVKEDQQKRKK